MCYKHVGGVKCHIWVATLKLAKPWHQAQVLCEHCAAGIQHVQGIEVPEPGAATCRTRWSYCWRFGYHMKKWLSTHLQPRWLIHAHKLATMRHVVVFRCAPFASVDNKP